MYSEEVIDNWMDSLSPNVALLIRSAEERETWTVDNDERIQTILADITCNFSGPDSSTANRKFITQQELAEISVDDLKRLQRHLSFARGVKMYGDILSLDPDKARMLLKPSPQSTVEDKEAISILLDRLVLLLRVNLFTDVFCHQRQDTLISILQTAFSEE